jgi:ferrochelatase
VTARPTDGVILIAHGTIRELSELPEFLVRIRRGRSPSPELVSEMEHRYRAIGGSPLLELTQAQARALERRLGVPVWAAMRLWNPPVEAALESAIERGVNRLCVIALAPFSAHVYFPAAEEALATLGAAARDRRLSLVDGGAWGGEPELVAAHAEAIRRVPAAALADTEVVLTAHSLPRAVISAGDPYADQVQACADAVAAALGRPCELAYQSQGADGGDWLGPDLSSRLQQAKRSGRRAVVAAPIGFLAEHVETLYDLDVEANAACAALGLEWYRVPALNDDPRLIEAMAVVAKRALSAAREAS